MNETTIPIYDSITVIEAAEISQISLYTIAIFIKTDSTFPAFQIDKKLFVDRTRLNDWLRVNKSIIKKSPTNVEIFNLREAARILRVSHSTIYKAIKNDPTFPAVQINNMWRIDRSDLKVWYENKFTDKILPQSEIEGANKCMIEKSTPDFDFITRKEAAEILGLNRRQSDALVKNDPTFPAFQINKKWVVDRPRLKAWYASKFSNEN